MTVSVPEDDSVSVELTPEETSDEDDKNEIGGEDDAAADSNRVVVGMTATAAVAPTGPYLSASVPSGTATHSASCSC